MKTKLILLMLLVLFAKGFGQQNLYSAKNIALPEMARLEENEIQAAFTNLDKSRIETGLLLDAAVEFADPTFIAF